MISPVRIPVSVLTGFLGSGKTTVLNHLLRHAALRDAAVLINEFGEVGIDHLLVRQVDDNVVQLASGCLCCATRGDLIGTLRDLYAKRSRRAVRRFRRMLVETSGLADPAPVLQTFMKDPLLLARFRLDGVVATVDAVHAGRQLERQFESVKQVAMADRLLLTKTDLVDAAAIDALSARVRRINPAAPIYAVVNGVIDPERLLDAGLYNPATKSADAQRWLNAELYDDDHSHRGEAAHGHHDDGIRAHCFTLAAPLDWPRFADALKTLMQQHGEDLLRIKGVLNVTGEAQPVVVNGVQHLFHPPMALPAWPGAARESKLVFITRGLAREIIERSLAGAVG